MRTVIKNRGKFDEALSLLAVFRSTMAYNDNPEVKALQEDFDKAFKGLRDTFQPKLDKAVDKFYAKGGRV